MGLAGELGHQLDVERLHDLLVEPRVERLERLHQDHRGGRLDRPMELDADVDARPHLLAQRLEPLDDLVDHLLAFVVLEWRARAPAQLHLHGVDAIGGIRAAVDPDAIARRAAHQLVDRHAVGLAGDVPQRLIDAARDRRLDRTAAIERTAMDGLPVKDHAARSCPMR